MKSSLSRDLRIVYLKNNENLRKITLDLTRQILLEFLLAFQQEMELVDPATKCYNRKGDVVQSKGRKNANGEKFIIY